MKVNSHYKDLLRVFDRHGVRYLIVGAYAVMVYTEPRYTKDFDVWVDPAPDNADNVYRALAEFGAPVAGLSPADFTQPEQVFQIGVDPIRIDVLLGIPDLEFASAWERRQVFDIGDLLATFLSKEDLIASKRVAGRSMDELDLYRLLQEHPKPR